MEPEREEILVVHGRDDLLLLLLSGNRLRDSTADLVLLMEDSESVFKSLQKRQIRKVHGCKKFLPAIA